MNRYSDACSGDELILEIVTADKTIILEKPMFARDVRCPDCGSSIGVFIPSNRGWCCRNSDCTNSWWKKKTFTSKPIDDKKPIDLTLYDLPQDFLETKDKTVYQPQKYLDVVKRYLCRPKGLLTFLGTSGVGKTHLACAMLTHLIGDRSPTPTARYLNLNDLFIDWKDGLSNHLSEKSVISPYIDAQILIIDELGNRNPTPSFQDIIYNLLNKRHSSHVTILTSNLSLEEIKNFYGDRILSRFGRGIIMTIEGKDRRRFGIPKNH